MLEALMTYVPTTGWTAVTIPARRPGCGPIRRTFDLAASLMLLVAVLPLLLTIYVAVRLTSRGPGIFLQRRVGLCGRVFHIYKFRTMVVDADARLAEHLATDDLARLEYRMFRKLRRDPRVTPVGAFLRKYSLDELPQLLNVAIGDMSLVGPRCYLPEEVPAMEGHDIEILSVLPGITGLWQVSGRNGTTFAERVRLDIAYVRQNSALLDLRILLKTVAVVLTARNAC